MALSYRMLTGRRLEGRRRKIILPKRKVKGGQVTVDGRNVEGNLGVHEKDTSRLINDQPCHHMQIPIVRDVNNS